MPMIHEMRRLRDEHHDLTRMAEQLLRLVQRPTPPPAAELTPVRFALRDALIRHLKCEDWVLYPQLMESGVPAAIAIAQELVAEMGDIADRFSAYCRRWTPDAITADWADYGVATKAFLDLLSVRIARENSQLYPLAEEQAARANPAPRRARR